MFKQDTITAVATPPGEGGLAIIRVSGPDALRIAGLIFHSRAGSDASRYSGYTVHYGRFIDCVTGEVADDGLLTVFRGPHSYTGENTVEFSCHGGRATTARVLQLTLDAGARLADPGEFTQRAFLNGRLDLAQAEAVADVIRARTESARRLARRQLDGALSKTILSLKDALIGILAAIEVTIDFSDEVGELDHTSILARITIVRQEIQRLLQTADRGRIMREGLRIAIVGRPNVGKSSLLNALLRQERAIVTPIAGTTRDLVEESANIEGVPVVIVDTAGIRESADIVERIGVERARSAASSADLVLFVLDASMAFSREDEIILQQLIAAEEIPIIAVLNKCDQCGPAECQNYFAAPGAGSLQALPSTRMRFAYISALTGEGLEELEHRLIRMVFKTEDQSYSDQCSSRERDSEENSDGNLTDTDASVVVANARHQKALEAAHQSLLEAEQTTQNLLPGDFIVIDVRGALDQLGQITGETVSEDIIHRIFHDFCVGK